MFDGMAKKGFAVSVSAVMIIVGFVALIPNEAQAAPYWYEWAPAKTYTIGTTHDGLLNLRVHVLKLIGETNTQYDWYAYRFGIESVSGYQLSAVSSYTEWTDARFTVNLVNGVRQAWLDDYDPSTTVGSTTKTTTVSVSLSDTVAAMLGMSWGYTMPDVKCTWLGKGYSYHNVEWKHEYRTKNWLGWVDPCAASKTGYQAEPGLLVYTLQNKPTCLNCDYYGVSFLHRVDVWNGRGYTTTWEHHSYSGLVSLSTVYVT